MGHDSESLWGFSVGRQSFRAIAMQYICEYVCLMQKIPCKVEYSSVVVMEDMMPLKIKLDISRC